MKQLDSDPAAALTALADEAQADWEELSRHDDAGLISAEDDA